MGWKKKKKILELYFLVVKSLFKPSNKYARIMSVDVALNAVIVDVTQRLA